MPDFSEFHPMQEEVIHSYPPLTSFSHGAGCGCKVSPTMLEELLQHLPKNQHRTVVADFSSRDDCAVIRLQRDLLLLTTADFFLPVVNDPSWFGKIAAANALSDIWAMGGTPVSAIALMGWPIDELPMSLAGEVLAAAQQVCLNAGISIHGGHTIHLKQPIFGLAVSGIVSESNLRQNNTAKPGDVLLLSKPIGAGLLLTAVKRNRRTEEQLHEQLRQIAQPNIRGIHYGTLPFVHAMTDVTGFGLLGHSGEMLGQHLDLSVQLKSIPVFPEVPEIIAEFCVPDAAYRNWNFMQPRYHGPADAYHLFVLSDPQTNGGLMLAVDPLHADELIRTEAALGYELVNIGSFSEGTGQIHAN